MKKSTVLVIVLLCILSFVSAVFYAQHMQKDASPSHVSGMLSPLVPLRSVLSAVETSKKSTEQVDVVVELPKGSHVRYRYDTHLGAMRYDRRLPSYVRYPGPYGILPFTTVERGGLVRAVVLSDQETFPGVVLDARPIALFVLGTPEKEEFVVLAVPVGDPLYTAVTGITNLSAEQREQVATAFNAYIDFSLQTLPFLRVENAEKTREFILDARERYAMKQ